MKEITIYQINMIADFKFNIFNEEDEDYPDGRKIRIWERASWNYLKPYTENQQYEIYGLIHWNDECTGDIRRLEEHGYTIIRDVKEQAEFILKNKLRKRIPFKY